MKSSKTVMLVDDDRTSNFLNKKILHNIYSNVEILDFVGSEEALDYLFSINNTDKHIDLILLDINMPEIDGWEFIEEIRLRKLINFSSIIMLSSSIDESDMVKSKLYQEIKGFISKPLKMEVMDELFN